jgi:uncharacterized YccA/Bax inhibitor family protein
MNTGNPVFGFLDKAHSVSRSESMTVNGTIWKTVFLLLLLTGSMAWIWPQQVSQTILIVLSIAALIVALGTSFVPSIAWIGAPVYAILEGLVLGVFSSIMEHIYPGIAVQAVGLTLGVLFAMLGLYVTRIIVVTQQFRSCLMAATTGIFLFYFIGMILGFFGVHVPGYDLSGGLVGIGISLVVVGIASFNLLLDFDAIERGAREGAPRSYEWICGFGLLVTLVWIYIEVLKLLARFNNRR